MLQQMSSKQLRPTLRASSFKILRQSFTTFRGSSLKWIPNALTVSRICMSPLISWQIITQQSDLALLTLVIASVTDVLDGYIARRYNMKTKLGSFLDPIADKVLVTTLVGSLWYTSALEPSLGGLILSRDILLVTGVGIYRAKALKFSRDFFNFRIATPHLEEVKPPMISKINTGLQLGLLGLLVGNGVLWEMPMFLLGLKYILYSLL